MAIELAKAYVQVIPSADGIKGKLQDLLGGDASSAGEDAGESYGTSMVNAIKSVIAAAGIGTALASAINEGAALQQSIGGVETLFGDAAETVKQYAAEAFETAGLSANDYMETVTGFAASLLQSMGNDTAAAAEKANTALTDMSDNANKMGSDMESIQNAYQGFAKQNYTMLDNLKLGYGGTQDEMQRLLEDAQAISGVEYDISSYADIVDAIHVIQTEMGITGTTATEASTTFTGSMASMKAAAQNLLGNLALGESLTPSLEALAETTNTFLTNNLLPMVGNILTTLPGILPAVITGAVSIAGNLAAQLPEILVSVVSGIQEVITSGLASIGLDQTAERFSELGESISGAFSLEGVLESLQSVGGYISDTFSPVLDALDECFSTILDTVSPLVQEFTDWATSEETANAATALLQTATEKLSEALTTVVSGVTDFVSWMASGSTGAETFKAALIGVAAGFAAWQVISTVSTLLTTLSTVIPAVTAAISGAKVAFAAFGAVLSANPIGVAVTAIAALAAGVIYLWNNCEESRTAVTAIWEGIKSAVSAGVSAVIGFFTSLWESIKSIWDGICNVIQVGVQLIGSVLEAAWDIITLPFQLIWQNCGDTITSVWNGITSTVSDAISAVSSVITTVVTAISTFMSSAWNGVRNVVTTVFNGISSIASSVWTAISSTISSVVGGIRDKVSSVFNAVKSIVSSVFNSIKSIATSLWNGIKSAITTPIETAKSTIKSILDAISGFFSGCKLELPSIKLPHFSITGEFSISPPSVPRLSISWYKQAMNNPLLLTDATIFGASGGSLLGGGEAGPEVVSGADTLMDMMYSTLSDGFVDELEQVNDNFERLFAILAQYYPQFASGGVYLDGDKLVGQLAPAIDRSLGQLTKTRGRGR